MKRNLAVSPATFKKLLCAVAVLIGVIVLVPVPVNSSGAVAESSTKVESRNLDAMVLADGKGLLASIQKRQKELDEREAALKARDERLHLVKKEIDEKIKEIEKIRSEMKRLAAKIEEADNNRVKRLVKIYESMTPEEAAPRFEQLDTRLAVLILSVMREKNAAKILELVKVDKSVTLSQLLKIKKY